MPVKKHQQTGDEKNKKINKVEARASLHNPMKLFWLLTLITCFNVGNNFTTTNASNILSEFPCSLTKISHGFNTYKTKNYCSCSHGNCKLTVVLLLQTIIYKEVLRFFLVIKTDLS